MKKYVEYLILFILMLPVMVSAINLTYSDYFERKQIDRVIKIIFPEVRSLAEHAINCDVQQIPSKSYSRNGKVISPQYVRWADGTIKIYMNSQFDDGYKFQSTYNFSFAINPKTRLCDLTQIGVGIDFEDSALIGHSNFQYLIPSLKCD